MEDAGPLLSFALNKQVKTAGQFIHRDLFIGETGAKKTSEQNILPESDNSTDGGGAQIASFARINEVQNRIRGWKSGKK